MRRLFRVLGFGLYTVLVALFILGYLARYLPPHFFWWTELIGVGLPYLSMALVAATLLTWRANWTLRIGHLVLLVLIALRFVGSSWWNGGADSGSDEALTLMTYNIPPWTGLSPGAQSDSLRQIVKRIHPDLIALQEAQITFQPNDTPRVKSHPYVMALAKTDGYHVIGPKENPPAHTPQPVFARLPLVEQSQRVLRKNDQDKKLTHVTRTRFRWKGRLAVHYNLHLRTFGERKPWEDGDARPLSARTWRSYLLQYRTALRDRAWEARQIQQMLEKEKLPLIVSGDFNSTPHGWAYRHLADGLTDAFRVAGDGWGGTYHSRYPFARIDFVLVSPDWKVLSAHVPDVRVSDHRPLVTRLAWKK